MTTNSSAAAIPIVSLAAKALRRRLLGVALNAPEFKRALKEGASEIKKAAKLDVSEATIEGCFERVVYAILRDIGLEFHPEKEVGVNIRRHAARGRADSRLGALVIEYKRPALLKTKAQIDEGLSQLHGYLTGLPKEGDAPIVGLLTNGLIVVEMRVMGGKTDISAPEPMSADSLLRLTELVISLAHTALTSANLIRDFCGSESDGVLFRLARSLDEVLAKNQQPKTTMLRSEWEEMFRLAHEDQSQQKRIEERRAALGDLFDVDVTDAGSEYRTLFSLHTAYAILLKLIAYRVVSDAYFGRVGQDFRSLADSSSSALRSFCSTLEEGSIFRQLGIVNLLEGDFFPWYSDKNQWTSQLADAIKEVLRILARYEETKNIFSSGEVPDLFRELYQAAVPRAVRSSFGEFYTPYWLAEHVLDAAVASTEDWTAIDPCCGSGTFVIAAITRIRREQATMAPASLLRDILSRVVAIDLNPLSVLTTRIHYFIHISDILARAPLDKLVIPVFLGDAASLPDAIQVDGVDCLRFRLKTLKTPIDTVFPISFVRDTERFLIVMQEYERRIKAKDSRSAQEILVKALPLTDRKAGVTTKIAEVTDILVDLERKGWNGIWARILSNFLSTACLGRFTAVIGNPPWIDWKNLPAGYRERIKGLCLDRGLFSGAGRTGGINLNICALISYVSMTIWLDDSGRLAFLMPRELANQASYEGWRRLGGKWRFLEFHDWSKAGHPFDPVKEDFMTFVIGKQKRSGPLPVVAFTKKRGDSSRVSGWRNKGEALWHLGRSDLVAGRVIPGGTAFTFAKNHYELDEFSLVAGECAYIGREGVEFYPQELLLFTFDGKGPREGTVWLRNIQVSKSKYRLPHRRILLETAYLHPLVKGPNIVPFSHKYNGLIVAFPYGKSDPMKPVPASELEKRSRLLHDFYEEAREVIEKQTKFSDVIRGQDPGEFYGLARTGPYSFADVYVAFRDNTKWCAGVVSSSRMPWGETRRFVFQNHAVSMCERPDGSFMNEDEAHYVCAILNAPLVERFINATSDQRSFKIRPPVYVPLFDPNDAVHRRLSDASKRAHLNPNEIPTIKLAIETDYLQLCRLVEREDAIDAEIARKRLSELKDNPDSLVRGSALKNRMKEWTS